VRVLQGDVLMASDTWSTYTTCRMQRERYRYVTLSYGLSSFGIMRTFVCRDVTR
jgi:hypothetical protein